MEEIGLQEKREEGDSPVDFTIMVGLGHPKSTGILRLASNNYKDYPLLDPKYLKDDRDVNTYIKGKSNKQFYSTRMQVRSIFFY